MSGDPTTEIATILVDLAVIIASGSLLASVAGSLRQPVVIGEIVAGILLGPTLLGRFPGHLTTRLFPPEEQPFLNVLANLGLVLFMCAVGFEFDRKQVRQVRPATGVSAGSVAVPFALGALLGLALYPHVYPAPGHRPGELAFVMFFGVATSITAFPVLARILTELRLHRSRMGAFVMASAAGADVMAWAILAFVVAVATGGSLGHAGIILGELVLFALALVFVVRPLLRWFLMTGVSERSNGKLPLLVIVVGLLLSSWFTTKLGFHPIFGAFIFGAALPTDAVQETAPEVPLLIEQASQLLVPAFFVTTGLSVNLFGLSPGGYLIALLVIVVACTGKFLGAAGATYLSGRDLRRASAVAVLMNSRGLTELVAIQVGITLGILNEELASIMIIMAVVTTIATTPLFRSLYNDRLRGEDETVPTGSAAPETTAA